VSGSSTPGHRDELVEVMTLVTRASEALLREMQHLRDDVREIHADIVQRDDVRHLARRVATSDQLDKLTEQLAAVVAELRRTRAHDVVVETPPPRREIAAPASALSAEVSARVRKLSEAARHLGNDVLDDLRARRGRPR
jgi:hypothetical protein